MTLCHRSTNKWSVHSFNTAVLIGAYGDFLLEPVKNVWLKDLLARTVHDILLKSLRPAMLFFFGITVMNSFFHLLGQTKDFYNEVANISQGITKKSENFVISIGNTSPGTIDFGLRDFLILEATWQVRSRRRERWCVQGI